uniref:Uncharacterized protein n=1 Tax=Romanomermis culicivorax TaxID=13658 RepID=A0A915HEY0_ROMCU
MVGEHARRATNKNMNRAYTLPIPHDRLRLTFCRTIIHMLKMWVETAGAELSLIVFCMYA